EVFSSLSEKNASRSGVFQLLTRDRPATHNDRLSALYMSYHVIYSLGLNQPLRRALLLFCIVLILTVCLPSSSLAQSGARTIPRSLDQLTAEADVTVHGYVTSARFEPHPQLRNLTTVVVTMRVIETFKGPTRKTITFRQYVWDLNQQKVAAGE